MVNRARGGFARAFAATETGERPVTLVHSLREAREWLAGIDRRTAVDSSPWTDPSRQGVMFRRGQRRDLPVRDRPAYAAD